MELLATMVDEGWLVDRELVGQVGVMKPVYSEAWVRSWPSPVDLRPCENARTRQCERRWQGARCDLTGAGGEDARLAGVGAALHRQFPLNPLDPLNTFLSVDAFYK